MKRIFIVAKFEIDRVTEVNQMLPTFRKYQKLLTHLVDTAIEHEVNLKDLKIVEEGR